MVNTRKLTNPKRSGTIEGANKTQKQLGMKRKKDAGGAKE